MRFSHRITYFSLSVLSKWIGQLSVARRYRLSQRLAGYIYNFIPLRKQIALQNLYRAFPEKSRTWRLKQLKLSYTFQVHAFLFFLAYPFSYHNANIRVVNKSVFTDAYASGRGVILVSGHYGLWELMMAWFGRNGFPFVGVGVQQKNRGAGQFSQELREWSGMQHIYRRRTTIDTMYEVLHQGKVLGLLADQDAKKRGIFVNFFNRPSSTPRGPSLFYQRSAAPLIFATITEEQRNSYVLKFSPVRAKRTDSFESITQEFTNLLENEIRNNPEQYFWFHRRWKTKSEPAVKHA
jgi:KDO2-lipid IV(A) lauroyltransferase